MAFKVKISGGEKSNKPEDYEEGFGRGISNDGPYENKQDSMTASGAAKYRKGDITKTIGGAKPGANSAKPKFKYKMKYS